MPPFSRSDPLGFRPEPTAVTPRRVESAIICPAWRLWKQALADPKVKAILLDVDSPGGVADGVKTLADQILAARGQKPIVAFAHGQMCSAAYWLGASADRVMADDTAMVGSIGTVMTHTDRSAAGCPAGP